MICQTIKNGIECGFMTKKGCGFIGGACKAIVEQCDGCGKVLEVAEAKYCGVYPDPAGKWRTGKCPTATHIKLEVKEAAQKINPLKASKRANKK
ncbi:MAG: PxxKW family cysteine-rich protein [Deltaproteobacteria bacterium]|nr:PxxKW family cysteine-rich protein [Deltaproteobacteria bacterium]